VTLATSWSTAADPSAAVDEAYACLVNKLGSVPRYMLAYFTEAYPAARLRECIGRIAPGVRVQGGTSCRGVITEAGMHCDDGRALALLGIADARGGYGVGGAPANGAPRAAARRALEAALADANRPGELPVLIWLNAAPGSEEQALAGIADVVGAAVPVLGASVADDEVAGRWRVLTRDAVFSDGIAVSVLFPSLRTGLAFQSGYLPTGSNGTVTAATGRIVHRIDARPAAEVYRSWTGTLLDDVPPQGGNVLELTTLSPLGREAGRIGEVPCYVLSHPDKLHADGSMSLFSEVQVGDRVFLMTGSQDGLVRRAGRVVQAAIEFGALDDHGVLGGVVVYCAGCMLTTRERIDEVATTLATSMRGRPYIGIFTFGEQGCLLGERAMHGNLMISSLVFGR